MFSDESKFNFVYSDGMRRVRRQVHTRLHPRYCQGAVKYGGGHVMVRGCFSMKILGPLDKIYGKMDRYMYKGILQKHFATSRLGDNAKSVDIPKGR